MNDTQHSIEEDEIKLISEDPCGCVHYSDGAIFYCEVHYLAILKQNLQRMLRGKSPTMISAITFSTGDRLSDLRQDIAEYEKIVREKDRS